MKKNKELMFQVSANLSEPEAVSFAKTLKPNERYYLVKVFDNPKASHLAKRERFVVVRNPRKGEIVQGGYAKFVDKRELRPVLPTNPTLDPSMT